MTLASHGVRPALMFALTGGCGQQFGVEVVSAKFKGLPPVKQHRMVTNSLKDEVAAMHAIRIVTRAA